MDTTPRNYRILREAADAFAKVAEVAGTIRQEDLGWGILGALRERTQLEEDEAAEIRAFWRERFFSDAYLHYDTPYPGVRELLHWIVDSGLKLVYLTGRNEPNMSEGTYASFRNHRLPADGEVRFIFKPAPDEPDLRFKDQSCRDLASRENVILAVENEPANANLMSYYFPNALVALIDTVTAPEPATPAPEILRFSSYL